MKDLIGRLNETLAVFDAATGKIILKYRSKEIDKTVSDIRAAIAATPDHASLYLNIYLRALKNNSKGSEKVFIENIIELVQKSYGTEKSAAEKHTAKLQAPS